MFPEYRGYGGNPGSPTEKGLALDAKGARAFLAAQGITWDRTVVYGESMGTGVATSWRPAHRLRRSSLKRRSPA